MTRTGKIARLPFAIREQLNQRLLDNEPGVMLVGWLNSLPEVNAILADQFHSQPIRPGNLSEWKNGGYRDWLIQREARLRTRDMFKQLPPVPGASRTPSPAGPAHPPIHPSASPSLHHSNTPFPASIHQSNNPPIHPSGPSTNPSIPPPAPAPGSALAPRESPSLPSGPKPGRNDPCPCGSGRKFKKCCLGK